MSEAPKPKVHEPDSLPWGTFFHHELQNLKIRTQLLQWEKFCESDRGRQEARDLIAAMIVECKQPHYVRVGKAVIQRILHAAVDSDKEFKGYSSKWVKNTLQAWWSMNASKWERRWYEEDEAKQQSQLPAPTENPHLNVDVMLESFRRTLVSEVPKVKNVEKEGAEWKSGIEQKATKHPSTQITVEQFVLRECVRRAGHELYRKRHTLNLHWFDVVGHSEQIAAENQKDANRIFSDAQLMLADALERFKKFGRV